MSAAPVVSLQGMHPAYALPQQLPGPAHAVGGPELPQHLSDCFDGIPCVCATGAGTERSLFKFRPPHSGHEARFVSEGKSNISI